jgi:hypothetical protein
MTNPQALSGAEIAEPEPQPAGRAGGNAAVQSCIRAWQYAYNKEFARIKDDYKAEKAALKAFRRALPNLAGYDNIRDFIACITYALVNEIMAENDVANCLDAAKIAIGHVRQEPRPPLERAHTSETSAKNMPQKGD